jgi:hypothetical protein
MGLDAVEFVIAVEDGFGIAIPNVVAEQLLTPRAVAEYVQSRLPAGDDMRCHSQLAFYTLRAAITRAYEIPRASITPDTVWRELLPGPGFTRKWKHLGRVVGATDWPGVTFFGYAFVRNRTVGETAEYLATRVPALIKGRGATWTRSEIDTVIAALMRDDLGIASFGWDDRFVEELRVD